MKPTLISTLLLVAVAWPHAASAQDKTEPCAAWAADYNATQKSTTTDMVYPINSTGPAIARLKQEEAACKAANPKPNPEQVKWLAGESKIQAEWISQVTAAAINAEACEDEAWVEKMLKNIASERANPSGVIDLAALHEYGEILARYRIELKDASARYNTATKKVWTPKLCN